MLPRYKKCKKSQNNKFLRLQPIEALVDILNTTKFIAKVIRGRRRSFNLIKPMKVLLEMKAPREKEADRVRLWSSMR